MPLRVLYVTDKLEIRQPDIYPGEHGGFTREDPTGESHFTVHCNDDDSGGIIFADPRRLPFNAIRKRHTHLKLVGSDPTIEAIILPNQTYEAQLSTGEQAAQFILTHYT